MGIRWLPHNIANEWVPIIQVGNDRAVVVRVSPFREFWRTTYLHWCNDLQKTVPCLGAASCPYCPQPSRITTYCPAAELNSRENRWVKRILAVNESMRAILEMPLDVTMFELRRHGRRNAPIRWNVVIGGGPGPGPLSGFDLEGSLKKCWGQQEEVG